MYTEMIFVIARKTEIEIIYTNLTRGAIIYKVRPNDFSYFILAIKKSILFYKKPSQTNFRFPEKKNPPY